MAFEVSSDVGRELINRHVTTLRILAQSHEDDIVKIATQEAGDVTVSFIVFRRTNGVISTRPRTR